MQATVPLGVHVNKTPPKMVSVDIRGNIFVIGVGTGRMFWGGPKISTLNFNLNPKPYTLNPGPYKAACLSLCWLLLFLAFVVLELGVGLREDGVANV